MPRVSIALTRLVLRQTKFRYQSLNSVGSSHICIIQNSYSGQTVRNMAQSSAVLPPPPITHILETILMVRDMEKSAEFYRTVFNVEPMLSSVCLSSQT